MKKNLIDWVDDDQRARLVIVINATVNKLVAGRKRREHQIGHKNHKKSFAREMISKRL